MSEIPSDRKYQESHEWALIDGESATVGITAHAVAELGDLVFIDLPEVGGSVTAGEAFGEIESVKAVSELISPVSGEITEVNGDLADALEALGESPYDKGWMIKVKLSGSSDHLMDSGAYEKQLAD